MRIGGELYFPTESGQWISEKQRRVNEILKDYDPYLELQWIPPGERGHQDYAFRVVDNRAKPYVVCFAHEADERLLAQVFGADQTRGNSLSYLEKYNAAREALQLKEAMEKNHEANELAYSILHSNKFHYKHNGVDYERGRYRDPR